MAPASSATFLGWMSAAVPLARRQRLGTLLDGPPSRRRLGWLDLLLRVHAAGTESFDEETAFELSIRL